MIRLAEIISELSISEIEKYTNKDFLVREHINRLQNVSVPEQGFNTGRTFPENVYVEKVDPSKRVNISTLKFSVNKTLKDKYFLCRNIREPYKNIGLETIVQDPEGEYAVRLSLHNYTTCDMRDDLVLKLPMGSIIVIQNPILKKLDDGEFSVFVKNPANVLFIKLHKYYENFQNLPWKGTFLCQYHISQIVDRKHLEYKTRGNQYFANRNYYKALDAYTLLLYSSDFYNTDLYKVDTLSNRSAVYLKLTSFSLALEDTEKVLGMNPLHIKAIYRKSKALYGLNRPVDALQFLEEKQKLFDSNDEAGKLIAREVKNFKDVSTDYDFARLRREAAEAECRRIEGLMEFTGSVQVVPYIEGKGRGMVATKRIKAGQLILASRAFEIYYAPLQPVSASDYDPLNGANAEERHLGTKILQRLQYDREARKEFCKQYPGLEDMKMRDGCWLDQDVKRIANIVDTNSLGGTHYVKYSDGTCAEYIFIGLWSLPSYINSSCFDWNTIVKFYGDFAFFKSFKDISKGEEILIPYLCPLTPFPVRTAGLQRTGFTCKCRLCDFNRNEPPEFHNVVLKNLREKIEAIKRQPDFPSVKYITILEKYISFLKKKRPGKDYLNLELVDLCLQTAICLNVGEKYDEALEYLISGVSIAEGTPLPNELATLTLNIIDALNQSSKVTGQKKVHEIKKWTAKLKTYFLALYETLDIMYAEEGERLGQDYKKYLLQQFGITF